MTVNLNLPGRSVLPLLLLLASPATAQLREDDPTVHEYTLRNATGMTVRFLDLGATITAVEVPDRQSKSANVVLGYGSTGEYRAKNTKNGFGAAIGRYAGRIANARFPLDGQTYRLRPNLGPHALHGGVGPGFDQRIWQVRRFREGRVDAAALTFVSPDGDQGFPGTLTVTITYRLLPDNSLRIDYAASTTKPTVLNLTNHSYFNLAGGGSVATQRLRIAATRWVETDDVGIPTGRLAPVAGTPLDFRTDHAIGERIDHKGPPMSGPGGYNHAWIVAPAMRAAPRPVLWMRDPASGRTLTVETTEPSVQLYTGDYIDGRDVDALGRPIGPRDGIAIETQGFADAPNHPNFPSTRLDPGKTFRSTTIYRFGAN
ncbi:aldose epimerase family protein [Sphingomonas arantia]|uniref:Aldose 1-epimerase n=1 Tax=Sphingomonas arantia TaxID=1460676 RepID=A0ABW4TXB5_9SPHN